MWAVVLGVVAFAGVLVALFMTQSEFPKTVEGFFAWLKSKSADSGNTPSDGE